jgi:hypothetical protein
MERLPPVEAREPVVPQAAGSGALRSTAYTLLAVILAAGLWLRFNNEIAAVAPSLAAPPALAGGQMSAPASPQGLIELGLLPASQSSAAVAEMGLPPSDAATLMQALQRGRLRLAHMPLLDGSLAPPGASHVMQVSAGGYTRQVVLTRDPTVVTMPIGPVATVTFRTMDPNGVDAVALTLAGPMRLPPLHANQVLALGVVAQ